MTGDSINRIAIPSIQEVQTSKSKEISEVDLIEENTNFVFGGSEEIQQIEIQATLVQELHPESFTIEEQIEEIKSLIDREPTLNDFVYNDKVGYIVVKDVNVPAQSDSDTIREVTISGSFLPWPKNFNQFRPTNFIFISGNSESSLDFFSRISYGNTYSYSYGRDEVVTSDPYLSFDIGMNSSLEFDTELSASLSIEPPSNYSGNYGKNYSSPNDSVSYGTDYGNEYGITQQ